MRPIKTSLATAALSTFLLASGHLTAAPTVTGWDLSPTESGHQQVRIHWSEPALVDMTTFPSANQIVLTIPGGALTAENLSSPSLDSSSPISRVRFQPVTMADGSEALSVTLTLATWQDMESVAGARWLTLRPTATAPELNDNSILKIARQSLDAPSASSTVELTSFGSAAAPARGAGQGTSAPAFYVPPGVEDPAQQAPDGDVGMLATLTKLDRRIDLTDFQGAPLEDVIRTIAKQLNLNIMMDPGTLPGTVTMELYNVKLSEALDALLKMKNRGYVIDRGGIIRIVDRRQISDDPDVTITVATIPVNWVAANDLKTVLDPFVSASGSGGGGGGSTRGRGITVSQHSNTLIIRDTPEKVAEVQSIIRQLDIPEKQVKMEVRLVDMTEGAARDFNLNFDIARDPLQNRLTGLPRNWTTPYADSGSFDFSASPDGITQEGLGNGLGLLSLVDLNPFLQAAKNANSVEISGDFISPEIYGLSEGGLSARNIFSAEVFGQEYRIDATLNALESRNEAITLAAPVILSLNNQAASIDITRQVPYQQGQNTDQGSVATISFIDVGTTINILPRITNNGFVTMRIEPEQTIQVGTALGVPILDRRTALSTVTVQDEETVAFGGLRQFESSSGEGGIPWLMRVPVVSWLFKNNSSYDQRKTELFLFVRPSIVKDPAPTAYEQAIFDKINYNWDLPDYYFDEVNPRMAPGEENDPFLKKR